jgi:hypothetical protein
MIIDSNEMLLSIFTIVLSHDYSVASTGISSLFKFFCPLKMTCGSDGDGGFFDCRDPLSII